MLVAKIRVVYAEPRERGVADLLYAFVTVVRLALVGHRIVAAMSEAELGRTLDIHVLLIEGEAVNT